MRGRVGVPGLVGSGRNTGRLSKPQIFLLVHCTYSQAKPSRALCILVLGGLTMFFCCTCADELLGLIYMVSDEGLGCEGMFDPCSWPMTVTLPGTSDDKLEGFR